jgi:hypothetical protein
MVILLASPACDKPDATGSAKGAASAPAASASASAPSTPSASAGPDAGAAAAAGGGADAGAASALKMPERPIPKGQTMVGASSPIEVQQKAIGYMVAMRAPRPDEAPADAAFANELAEKLKPIVRTIDPGSAEAKAKLNRIEVEAGGRQINLLMAAGCDARTPVRAVVQGAGVQLATLASRGVLAVRCNDARIQCFQSTRDPEDVLCTTAPRHK